MPEGDFKMFIAPYWAQNEDGVKVTATLVFVRDEERARALAMEQCLDQFKAEAGWRNHGCGLIDTAKNSVREDLELWLHDGERVNA